METRDTLAEAPDAAARRLRASEAARLGLILAWLLFMASTSLWLPGYNGTTGGEADILTAFYALVAMAAALGVRGRAPSVAAALIGAVPLVVLMALVGLAGAVQVEQQSQDRGEPIYLYFGVALLASWATLLIATAITSRTAWHRPAGVGLGIVVAVVGFFLVVASFD